MLTVIKTRELIKLMLVRLDDPAPIERQEFRDMLLEAEKNTHRNPRIKPTSRRVSRKMDALTVLAIKKHNLEHPEASNREIAEALDVQGGRVTEVLQGKYDKLLPREVQALFASHDKPSIKQLDLTMRKAA